METRHLQDFLEFCRRNLPSSFAQNFQDLFALWLFNGKQHGYFVEFGALNGRDFSNSYTLEKAGWDGIVAEPHPDFIERVRAVRNCHVCDLCVYDSSGLIVEFRTVVGRPALSAIGETQLDDNKSALRERYRSHPVRTISLGDLLDHYSAPDDIDFISIDTEGSEARILSSFDFKRRLVRSFCIEHNDVQRSQLAAIMRGHGYQNIFPAISGHDDWWIHESVRLPESTADVQISSLISETFEQGLTHRRKVLLQHISQLSCQ